MYSRKENLFAKGIFEKEDKIKTCTEDNQHQHYT